jgi:hypothetical protein
VTFAAGDRVQAHPATDTWMMGDRYGTIVRVHTGKRGTVYDVAMDRSARRKVFAAADLLPVD